MQNICVCANFFCYHYFLNCSGPNVQGRGLEVASEWENASLLSDIRIRTPVSPEKLPEFPKSFTEKILKYQLLRRLETECQTK